MDKNDNHVKQYIKSKIMFEKFIILIFLLKATVKNTPCGVVNCSKLDFATQEALLT